MTSPVQARAKHILLVEDEAIIALSESFMLNKSGYEVHLAHSGEEALKLIGDGHIPDLILMDIDLGSGIDGTMTAKGILAQREIPIVFLTSHTTKEMVEKARGLTRYGYVVKNSGEYVLLSAVETAFDLSEKERRIAEEDRVLKRAEKTLHMGYWFVWPGESAISLSEGSREILGLSDERVSFDVFHRQVLSDASEARATAFRELIDRGTPYDITYKIRHAETGEIVTLRSSGRAYGDIVIGVLQDITEIERIIAERRMIEERQAITLRSIGDGVISTDTEGRVVELNRMAEQLTGYNGAEAAGKPVGEIFEIINADTRVPVENPIRKVIESGYTVGLANHTVLIARDGTERHIADSAAPIRDDGSSLLGVVLVFRDVSAEYAAHEKLRRDAEFFQTLFMKSHTPMLLVDPRDGSIREANCASGRFYGWALEKLKAMNIAEINVLSPKEIAKEMELAVKLGRAEFSFVHRLANGETRPVTVTSGPVQWDGKDYLLSIISDDADSRLGKSA